MIQPDAVIARVAARLETVAAVVAPGCPAERGGGPGDDVATFLESLLVGIGPQPTLERVWALLTAAWGFYPTSDQTQEARRLIELSGPRLAALWLMDRALELNPTATATNGLRLVTAEVVIDVSHTARSDLHTGIQKVVRSTVPLWAGHHPVVAVSWADDASGWEELSPIGRGRVLEWGRDRPGDDDPPQATPVLVLPWHTVVVLMELPTMETVTRLAAVAEVSGNRVVAVGHDTIPVVRADELHPEQVTLFTRYLGVLKHARRIAAVSHSAAREFCGFSSAVRPQGLPGPTVVACPLASDPPLSSSSAATDASRAPAVEVDPSILCVGTVEPRKNHLAVLHACEVLWREGRSFSLVLISGSAWATEQLERIEELRAAGRPVELRVGASDEELSEAYRRARFSVLASLHEGFGLPVSESLAYGTPVVTSDYGGTRESAAGGGAVLVDPRDDEALVEALRRLLTDDEEIARLRSEAARRAPRRAADYAERLWEQLVEPELRAEEITG